MRATARTPASIALSGVADFRDAIVRRSVRDVVADRIAGLIASGILRPGDPLPGERDLAAALSVSRDTVRGAVQILVLRGVLGVSQGARTRVLRADVGPVAFGSATARAVDAYPLDAVHDARILVEGRAVADAARRIDGATLAALDASLRAQAAADGDPVRFLIADRDFHVAIYRASGNPLLADFATDLYAYAMDRRRIAMARPGAVARSLADHVAIAEALRARDPAAAAAAFAAHTERVRETTRPLLGGSGEAGPPAG